MSRHKTYKTICDTIGQAEVSRLTDYSPATISMVYHNKYPASSLAVISRTLKKCGGSKMTKAEQVIPVIPDGFMEDSQGRLVRIENIREIDLARDELVKEIVARAKDVAADLAAFKSRAMGDIAAFIELAAEKYEVKLGGVKGNVSLRSFDNRYLVQLAVAEYLVFDEGLQAAKELIDECLREWTNNSRPEIQTLINDAFQVDKEGRINTKRVLSLRRLDIRDEKWRRAMDAISDALSVAGSKSYVRIYERDPETGSCAQVALDIAR